MAINWSIARSKGEILFVKGCFERSHNATSPEGDENGQSMKLLKVSQRNKATTDSIKTQNGNLEHTQV